MNTNVTNAHHVVLWRFFARSFVGKNLSYNTIEDRCCRWCDPHNDDAMFYKLSQKQEQRNAHNRMLLAWVCYHIIACYVVVYHVAYFHKSMFVDISYIRKYYCPKHIYLDGTDKKISINTSPYFQGENLNEQTDKMRITVSSPCR